MGTIQFGNVYYALIIPIIVMIVTNTINQLGGLNGLETICPAIILIWVNRNILTGIATAHDWTIGYVAHISSTSMFKAKYL